MYTQRQKQLISIASAMQRFYRQALILKICCLLRASSSVSSSPITLHPLFLPQLIRFPASVPSLASCVSWTVHVLLLDNLLLLQSIRSRLAPLANMAPTTESLNGGKIHYCIMPPNPTDETVCSELQHHVLLSIINSHLYILAGLIIFAVAATDISMANRLFSTWWGRARFILVVYAGYVATMKLCAVLFDNL
jgi:hypothetical protein